MAQRPAAQCPCRPAWASAWTTSGVGFPSWMLCPSEGSWSAPWTAQDLCALPFVLLGVVQYSYRSPWALSPRGRSPLGALPSWTDPSRPLLGLGLPSLLKLGYSSQSFSLKLFLPCGPVPSPKSVSSQGLLLTKGLFSARLSGCPPFSPLPVNPGSHSHVSAP